MLKSYNGAILLYRQTGSGKTFTMLGDLKNKSKYGIITHSIDYIFKQLDIIIEKEQFIKYTIKFDLIIPYI